MYACLSGRRSRKEQNEIVHLILDEKRMDSSSRTKYDSSERERERERESLVMKDHTPEIKVSVQGDEILSVYRRADVILWKRYPGISRISFDFRHEGVGIGILGQLWQQPTIMKPFQTTKSKYDQQKTSRIYAGYRFVVAKIWGLCHSLSLS